MTEVRSMIYFSSFRMWQLPQPYSPQSEYKWGQQQPALQPLGKDELCPCMSTEERQQAAAGRGAGGALLLAALAGAPGLARRAHEGREGPTGLVHSCRWSVAVC